MGFWRVSWWSLMVGLIFCSLYPEVCRSDVLSRPRRQQWRNQQPGWGSPRESSWDTQSRRYGWGSVSGWDNPARSDSGVSNLRQLLPQQSSVRVRCNEDSMVVTVRRDLFGNGKLVKVSDLSLGSESCAPGPQNTDAVVNFEIGLQECGNRVQMTADLLIYTTTLNYSPTANRNSPIIRTNSATISIQCNYPRHGNVSSKAVKPTWLPFSTTISLEERLSFSLLLMNDDWSAPRSSSIFSLGETFYIEATLDLGNHIDMTLFADSCVATLSPDVSSVPRYEIIGLYGCLLDGKQEDSSSAFRSPRSQQNKLQFMVDAFRFTNSDLSTIYITCNLRAAPASQAPDPVNKACSFDKTRNTWISLDGPNNICACCESGVCAPSGGQSRRLFDYYPWSRRIGKRTVEETLQATLGPLYLINNNPYKSLSHQEEPQTMTVGRWTLLASVCLVLVVLSVCIAVTIQHFYRKNQQSAK